MNLLEGTRSPRPNEGSTSGFAPEISIREMRDGEDATAFRTLNEEWISRFFVLEAKDREQLGNPGKILSQEATSFWWSEAGRRLGALR